MKLLNVDYVGAELVKDLQNGCVFKSKKERGNLNPCGRDSLNHYLSGFDHRQLSGRTFRNKQHKRKEIY